MSVELVVARDAEEACELAAELLVGAVRGGWSIAVSGGSTPRPAYERAATLEPDWGEVGLWLADDRCVPPDDPRSNQRLVRETILDLVEAQPRWHAIDADAGVEGAAARYDTRMRAEGPPALVLLGMGDDGHTASLFPGSPALEATDRLVVAAEAGMEPYVPRVTMTLSAIAAAAHVVFLVTGAGKAARVPQAFTGPGVATVPASLARSAAGRTTAILDAAAASGLR